MAEQAARYERNLCGYAFMLFHAVSGGGGVTTMTSERNMVRVFIVLDGVRGEDARPAFAHAFQNIEYRSAARLRQNSPSGGRMRERKYAAQ